MSKRYEEGLKLRRKVLGDEHVDRSLKEVADFPVKQPLENLAIEYCWGEVWSRPDLDLKTRALITVATNVALDKPHELEIHIRGALRVGCTKEQIFETVLHSGIYSGLPATQVGYRVLKKVFLDIEK